MVDLNTTLALLDWRDRQLEAITEQLEDAMPALLSQLDALVEQSSSWKLAWREVITSKEIIAMVDAWKAEQLRMAVKRAEEEMSAALQNLPQHPGRHGISGSDMGTLLPAAAGMGLLAASIAAIPAVATFATVTSTSFAVFAVATLSWPLLAVGAAGVATAAVLGSTLLNRADNRWRQNWKERQRSWAYRQMLGLGEPRGARSFLSDLQTVILVAGTNRLERLP
jgi:hypothetical protein